MEVQKVEFEVRANASGKNEAAHVQPEQSPVKLRPGQLEIRPEERRLGTASAARTAPTTPAAPAERAQVGHLLAQTVVGRIKSFRGNWGFVNSDSFAGDLFIHAKLNPDLGPVAAGDPVQLEIAEGPTSKTGEYHAVNAVLLKGDVHSLVGQTLRGWVKSFRGNWGLINSHRFDGDVAVGVRANPQLGAGGLMQGESVEFQIVKDDKSNNGIQAVKAKHLAEVYQLALPTTAASPASAAPRTAALGAGPGLGRTEPHGSLAGCSTAQKITAKGMEALDAPRRKTPGWDRVTE